jgi:hypothetical protein
MMTLLLNWLFRRRRLESGELEQWARVVHSPYRGS